ncbi:MAG TPA: diguanylate cyclase, partial [Leptolyngbyaceae cyanobacterium]
KPFQVEEVVARLENQLTIQRQKRWLQQEIAQRQTTEVSLQQSQTLLSSILNSALDGIAALQAVRDETGAIIDFRCLLVNPTLASLLGQTPDELKNQLVWQTHLADLVPDLFNALVQSVNTGKPLEQDFCNVLSGGLHWYQISAVKLGDGLTLTLRDITSRKQAELALKEANLKLETLAHFDSLTGIANRRRFDEHFEREWQRLAREHQPLSLILLDVDYFKRYNDYYGHQQGDECLLRLAQTLELLTHRSADLVARYGGEEFAIVLPGTHAEGAIAVSERVQTAIQALAIPHCQSQVRDTVSVSMGIASTQPTVADFPELLIERADKALYQAKQRGRNQYFVDSL